MLYFNGENNYCGSAIYKITNVSSGKVYVGSTRNVNLRYKQYQAAFETEKAINKDLVRDIELGNEFVFEIIEKLDRKVSEYELRGLEEEYMYRLDSIDNGYNCDRPNITPMNESIRDLVAHIYGKEWSSAERTLDIIKQRSFEY